VPVAEVRRFEGELLEWFRLRHRDILDAIRTSGDIPDVEAFDVAIKGFAEQFSWEQAAEASKGAAPATTPDADEASAAEASAGPASAEPEEAAAAEDAQPSEVASEASD
jgi:hypothetical protein